MLATIVEMIQNNPGVAKIKKLLKDMLYQCSSAAAGFLKKADAIYQLKRMQYPDSKELKEMKKSIDEVFSDLVLQFVNLDEERIEVEDAYKREYERHLKLSAEKAIKEILEKESNALGKNALFALHAEVGSVAPTESEEDKALWKQLEESQKQRRAAEEERKRVKEEERRKAKEKKEADLREYAEATEKWEKACEVVRKKRAAYVDEKVAAERRTLQGAADKERDKAVADAEKTISIERERKDDAARTLSALGVFQFGQKKAQKRIIEDAELRIARAEAALFEAKAAYKRDVAAMEQKIKKMETSLQWEAEKKFVMPDKPVKPS